MNCHGGNRVVRRPEGKLVRSRLQSTPFVSRDLAYIPHDSILTVDSTKLQARPFA
jgi:hypothetical protein